MGRVALIICSATLLLSSGCGHKQPSVDDSINHIQQSLTHAQDQSCIDDPTLEVCQ